MMPWEVPGEIPAMLRRDADNVAPFMRGTESLVANGSSTFSEIIDRTSPAAQRMPWEPA